MIQLPIDIVPGSTPTTFRWQQKVDTVNGIQVQVCEGSTMPSMADAIEQLINLCKRQQEHITKLQKQIEGHCERIAAAHEVIAKNAERKDAPSTTTTKRKG